MKRNGSLNVLLLGTDPATGVARYAITYAPYDRRGGALPAREARSETEVMSFLTEVGINPQARETAVAELRRSRRVSIPNVALSDEELRRYGLQEMGIIQSVISYLST